LTETKLTKNRISLAGFNTIFWRFYNGLLFGPPCLFVLPALCGWPPNSPDLNGERYEVQPAEFENRVWR